MENFRGYGECGLYLLFKKNYPYLEIIANDRVVLCGYEIDIFFPTLNVGIEYNGNCHFEPVFGKDALIRTKANDKFKREIAKLKKIKLHTVRQTTARITHEALIVKFKNLCHKMKLPEPTDLSLNYGEIMKEKGQFI